MTPTLLIQRANAFCEKHAIALSTLSAKILGSGKELKLIAAGQRKIQFDTMERAFQKLEELERKAAAAEDRKDAA